MKALLVSSNSGSRGGGEIYLQRLAAGLNDLGHEVHALLSTAPAMDEMARLMKGSATLHRAPLRNMYRRPLRTLGSVLDRAQIRRLENVFLTVSPDVLHLNQQVAEDGLDLLAAARRTGLPRVSTVHIPGAPSALGAAGGRLRDRLTRSALAADDSLLIAVSESSGRELTRWLPFLEERLRIVRNGVPTDSEAVARASRARYRQEWKVEPGELVLGALGRLEPQKDPLFLLEVASRLLESGLPIRVVWVGDGSLRAEVEERAERSPLVGRVHVDGWRADAPQRLHGFDLFVMPSRFEGLPLALLEALRAGLACCASRTSGIPEAIADGENGRLCEAGDLEGWTTTLGDLVEHPDERQRLGRAARADSEKRFSLETMASTTAGVYREAIARNPRRVA